MEFINNIWGALTVPNEGLINIIALPLYFVEAYIFMLIFTTFLNISCTNQQKLSYVACIGIISILNKLIITQPTIQILSNLIISFILIKFIFKVNFPTAIFSQILPYLITCIVGFIFSNLYYMITGNNYNDYITIPIQRLLYFVIIYPTMFFIYLWLKKSNLNMKFINCMKHKNKINLILTSIFGILIVSVQSYITTYYTTNLSPIIGLLSFIILISYFAISIYSLTNMAKLEVATQELESAEAFNKSLSTLHDNVRGFKHDFDNIVSTIGRLCKNRRY